MALIAFQKSYDDGDVFQATSEAVLIEARSSLQEAMQIYYGDFTIGHDK